jgi:hypothetical protein
MQPSSAGTRPEHLGECARHLCVFDALCFSFYIVFDPRELDVKRFSVGCENEVTGSWVAVFRFSDASRVDDVSSTGERFVVGEVSVTLLDPSKATFFTQIASGTCGAHRNIHYWF